MTLIKLYWHILAEVRAFGGLSDYDTLVTRYHNPVDSRVRVATSDMVPIGTNLEAFVTFSLLVLQDMLKAAQRTRHTFIAADELVTTLYHSTSVSVRL